MNKSPQSNFSPYFAANNTKIPAYGMVRKELNLGLRRPFIWTFIIADPSILTVDANISFKNILSEYPDLSNPFLISKSASHGTVHHIITTGPTVTARPRRLHPKLYDAVKVEFEFLLAQGIIRPSKSPWSSPLHVVPKSDSTVRPVGDYRQLNSVTEFDSYPMPYLNDFAHALHGKKIFSKIDIFKAFHQIPIAECDIPKTAVTTPWGLYEYTPFVFWPCECTTNLMRFMHEPLPEKVQAVLDYKQPETVGSLRKFLGLLNFYRRFLPKAAEEQYLLSEFLKGYKGKKDSKPLNWSSEAITAFQRCKQALADAALLAHPSPSAPLALHVDASDYAIGGALHQVVDSELQPLAFFSRKLTSSEKSYSAYDRELLAIYSAIRHFRYMLEARDFTVFTDHKPSLMLLGKKVTSVLHGRSVSWISSLSSPQILYTFQDLTILLLMFSLVFLQSPSQVKLTMTVLLRHNRLIRSFTPNSIWNFLLNSKGNFFPIRLLKLCVIYQRAQPDPTSQNSIAKMFSLLCIIYPILAYVDQCI
ncbi:transposon Tf2-8 polyprotein [Trichonephila clavipes]|nr:transposon Tf2-8 polyprotein [Trichonephila clavipes]